MSMLDDRTPGPAALTEMRDRDARWRRAGEPEGTTA
jgi:hypothetical protein